MSFVKPFWALLAIAFAPSWVLAESPQIGGTSRWATFENAGNEYFALSVQADPRGNYPRAEADEVVILFDTSATQTGAVRIEGLEVVDELARSLTSAARVSLLACDVETVPLSDGFVTGFDAQWESALERLKKRIPLGTTNLGNALKVASEQFSDAAAQRTIIYIGDGISRTNLLTNEQQRSLVGKLVENRITFSSLAIGPVLDIATLAALSNHTGGILLSREQIEESTQSIGRVLGRSTAMPVIWVTEAQTPAALASHFPQTFPPLRADRDTILIGESKTAAESGELVLEGICGSQPISVKIDVAPEVSNPDMGFLTSVVAQAGKDGGLTLPALGSEGLRAMSLMLADSANAMVKSGRFALKAGEVESAIRIAEEALKSDPNNAEAESLLNAAKSMIESKVPTGKFTQFGGAQDEFGGGIIPNAGDLLAEEQAMRRAAGQALEASVRDQLSSAAKQLRTDPTGVKNSLKLLLEELDGAVDLDATLRAQLQDRVRTAIRMAAAEEARYYDRVQAQETIRSQADQAQRLLAETGRREEALKQLVEQFNFLMEQEQYLAASKEVAPEVSELAPQSALDNVTREVSSIAANQNLVREAFEAREQGFVDAMRGVEEAAVPFDGVPPLVYPPAEVWRALTARRKERYGSINLAGSNDSEAKIYSALKTELEELTYQGTPLSTVLEELKDQLNIPIWINQFELEAVGAEADSPIVLNVPPISLRSALRLMLEPLELTYIIRNEVLEITSKDSAERDPINKVYPVGDLVVPPMPMGGGMMGGGMMGGMGGGMGGMGGGMGGMGGMGGGMGGMGGGMMGGMGGGMMGGGFAVPDDQSKSTSSSPMAKHHGSSDVDPEAWVKQFESADEKMSVLLDEKLRRLINSKVELASAHLEAKNEAAAVQEFEQVIDLIGGLLCAGYPQPWMYQTLSLSMEVCRYPKSDIQRVLLSGLDFDGDTNQSFKLARYFAGRGMKKEALGLLRDIATVEPFRYDVFALALPLAAELRDPDEMRWVCLGVLSKAWPKEQAHLFDEARVHAIATQTRLAQTGRVVESRVFEKEIQDAMIRDIAVRVNWSGEADLDIRVKEPAGTICSLSNPQTMSGGVLLGDASSTSEKASIDGYSEYYVCSTGYAGQYDILIRKVWGEVAGGKATVEIYTDYGTPEQSVVVKQIDISESDAILQVAVKTGHRKQPIAETQLASVRNKQFDAGLEVLGQLSSGSSSSSGDLQDYINFRRALALQNGRRGFGFPIGGGVVGYEPQITTLPEGANMFVTGVVSADRRYVRISPSPQFNGIGEVTTFNFVSGNTGQGGAGGGGFGGGGLGGGGLGGGLGGGGGIGGGF